MTPGHPAELLASVNSPSESKTGRRHDAIAMVSCGAVLVLALVLGYFHKVGTYGVETDFYGAYAPQTQNIMEGRPYTYQHNPPGYMLLLAALSLLTDDVFVAGKLLSAFATGLFGWITYLLLKALFGSRIALVSTVLVLLTLIPHSFVAATDIVGAVAIILPLWILLRRPIPTFQVCFLTGILAGVAYLIRSNAIFVILGITVSLVVINLTQEALRGRLLKVGLFLGGVLLITFPWLIINWQTNGSPFASTAYLQIAAQFYHPDPRASQYGTAITQAAATFSSLSDVVLYDPPTFVGKYFQGILLTNMRRLAAQGQGSLVFQAVGAGLLVSAAIGLLFLCRDLSRRRLTFLVTCLLGYALLGLVGFHFRYYFFLLPCFFALVIYCFFHERVVTALRFVPFGRPAVSWLLVIALCVFQGLGAYLLSRGVINAEPRYLIEIADVLKSRSLADGVIILRKPHLAYLAGLEAAFPLAETADEYLVKAREIGARYIVYSDSEASQWPGLKSLSNPDALPKDFKLIYLHEPTRTLVYEIDSRKGEL